MSASPAPDGALKPTLSVFDVVAITVSAVTPASSVFVIREHPYRMPLWPVPAILAVLGAGYLLFNLILEASVRDITVIIGLLAVSVSVILYCVSGRSSPAFQKL